MANLATAIADFTPSILQQVTQSSQDDSIKYVFFEKGDILSVEATYDSGWWYGYVKFKNQSKKGELKEKDESESEEEEEEEEGRKSEAKIGGRAESAPGKGEAGMNAKPVNENEPSPDDEKDDEIRKDEPNKKEREAPPQASTENKEQKPETLESGFFPSNFVSFQPYNQSHSENDNKNRTENYNEHSGDNDSYEEPEENEREEESQSAKRKSEVDWMSYAKGLLDDNAIETQTRVTNYTKLSEQFYEGDNFSTPSSNMMGILGYKKIKFSGAENFKANIPGAIVSQGTAAIPIKDQSPLSKAYRQLYHYFDYDSWNEQMNRGGFHKARPDATRKKDKKKKLKL